MQHVTRLPAKHTRVYNQLKDGGETGPGVNSNVSDYNSELLSEALPQLSHDWPCLSRFFFFAARLLAFPLMSTICSHSNSDILFLGTRQHWWCPSVVCGWWNWSEVFEGFSQYLLVLFSRLRLIILYIRRRRSSHSRTVRAFAHLILHNHVNDLRNARFWTLVFK